METKSQLYNLLKRPIITEKSTQMGELNQYVFEVSNDTNKVELAKAFELAFPGRKVTNVRITKIPTTTRRVGRNVGRILPRKKAIFSIEGEPIELIPGG
tara:strand:- start:7 stop:303 length:297 start_codon:yes stop_codon:yes gene_type:complete